MVYCGKPSKSCDECRKRRTKCDRIVPSCSQCIRTGRKCPGYRDEQSLIFRDMTSKTAGRSISKTKSPDEDITSDTVSAETSSSKAPASLISRCPTRIIEEEAVNFFFYHFVFRGPNGGHGLFDFLPALYQQAVTTNDPLKEIITASGMAGVANLKGSPQVMAIARKKQTQVLRATNMAIQDPKKATSDRTLITVLMLCLFEIITCDSPRSLQIWAGHVKGALILAQMRGKRQLESEMGRRIFLHLRNQCLVTCLQYREPVPDAVRDWNQPGTLTEVDSRLFDLLIRVCDLRYTHKTRGRIDEELLEQAKSIDADLEHWALTTPMPRWRCTSLANAKTFLKERHIYETMWHATAWNMYRVARLLTSDLLVLHMKGYVDHEDDVPEPAEKIRAMQRQMCDEICATAPFYINGDEIFTRSGLAMRAAGGYALLWPLYTAAQFHRSPERTAWIISQYDKIRDAYGLRQADALAKVLKTTRDITVFDEEVSLPLPEEEEEEASEW